jgi:4'-phosphopantetheinyl transferase
MPLLKIESLGPCAQWGVWKIDETIKALKEQIELDAAEETQFSSFKSEVRGKQWLSYRILLNEMLSPAPAYLAYDENGKPALRNSNLFISISHSGEYSAVITSEFCPVGIDIERIKDRIFRIKDRFLTEEEDQNIGRNHKLEKLYVAWGAKEALYKAYGRPEVEFRRDIYIDSFDYLCSGKGQCTARMNTPEGLEEYTVFYERISDYMLVYALKSDRKK